MHFSDDISKSARKPAAAIDASFTAPCKGGVTASAPPPRERPRSTVVTVSLKHVADEGGGVDGVCVFAVC